jgi:hypothetical protein
MTNLVTPDNSLIPGVRLIDGTLMQSIIDGLNALQSGAQSVSSVTATGNISAGGTITATGAISSSSSLTATFVRGSVSASVTAAGTTRADATALTSEINDLTTVALNTGVILPASATVGIGGFVVVFNNGANPAQVYGAGSDTIDSVAGSTGVPLTNAKRCIYYCIAANTFISAQLGVVSA